VSLPGSTSGRMTTARLCSLTGTCPGATFSRNNRPLPPSAGLDAGRDYVSRQSNPNAPLAEIVSVSGQPQPVDAVLDCRHRGRRRSGRVQTDRRTSTAVHAVAPRSRSFDHANRSSSLSSRTCASPSASKRTHVPGLRLSQRTSVSRVVHGQEASPVSSIDMSHIIAGICERFCLLVVRTVGDR
jgi:hypothetical protein